MSHSRRVLRAIILAGVVSSLLGATALAAPGPKPSKNGPSFSATLNRDAYSAAGQQYVAMTFTSTEAKAARGQMQITVPARQHPTQLYWTFFSWLQTTEPTWTPGYIRVEAKSCTSATLAGITTGSVGAGNVVTSIPTINVDFDCQPGQQFVIHWFTNLGFNGFNPGIEDPEKWPVLVATRKGPDAKWTQGAPLEIRIRPSYVNLPPLPFITPPLELVSVTPIITAPEEPVRLWNLVGDGIALDTNVSSEIVIDNIWRADTGGSLTIVNEYNFRVDTPIQIIDCIDINVAIADMPDLPEGNEAYNFDCDANPFVIQIDNPGEDSLHNADGTLLSQNAVIAAVLSWTINPNNYIAANSHCTFRGGSWAPGNIPGTIWTCALPFPAPNNDHFFEVAVDLMQPQYCPTSNMREDPATVAFQIIVCVL